MVFFIQLTDKKVSISFLLKTTSFLKLKDIVFEFKQKKS